MIKNKIDFIKNNNKYNYIKLFLLLLLCKRHDNNYLPIHIINIQSHGITTITVVLTLPVSYYKQISQLIHYDIVDICIPIPIHENRRQFGW